MTRSRYETGLQNLTKIDGEAGEKVIESLADIAPDLGRYIIEFGFGDIYQRSGLDLKTKELVTIAALSVLGHCQPQLNVHVHGALNVGCTEKEVVDTIIHISLYGGFPAALNAMFVAKEVFQERGLIT